MFAKNPMAIEEKPQLNEPLVDEGERVKQRAEQRGADTVATFEDNVDGELLEIFSALGHGSEDGELMMEDGGEFARPDYRRW